MNKRIKAAIVATKGYIPGYFENTCKKHMKHGAGSIYEDIETVEQMEAALLDADWVPATHPDVMPGCTAFKTTSIKSGRYGLVEIDSLPDDVSLVASDPKGTGCVSMTVKGTRGEKTDETWIILGNEDGHEVVFTFHPGKPVRPSVVTVVDCPDGKALSKSEAINLGFKLAQVVG